MSDRTELPDHVLEAWGNLYGSSPSELANAELRQAKIDYNFLAPQQDDSNQRSPDKQTIAEPLKENVMPITDKPTSADAWRQEWLSRAAGSRRHAMGQAPDDRDENISRARREVAYAGQVAAAEKTIRSFWDTQRPSEETKLQVSQRPGKRM